MPNLSPEMLALLDAADADREYVAVTIGLPGDREVTVNFLPTASTTNGLRTVRSVIATYEGDDKLAQALAMFGWLRGLAATDADRELLDELDRRSYLTGEALRAVMEAVMSAAGGRPTMQSSPSASGSVATGNTSTGTAPLTAPTPGASPSTVS